MPEIGSWAEVNNKTVFDRAKSKVPFTKTRSERKAYEKDMISRGGDKAAPGFIRRHALGLTGMALAGAGGLATGLVAGGYIGGETQQYGEQAGYFGNYGGPFQTGGSTGPSFTI